jgi:hypothetical protein
MIRICAILGTETVIRSESTEIATSRFLTRDRHAATATKGPSTPATYI